MKRSNVHPGSVNQSVSDNLQSGSDVQGQISAEVVLSTGDNSNNSS